MIEVYDIKNVETEKEEITEDKTVQILREIRDIASNVLRSLPPKSIKRAVKTIETIKALNVAIKCVEKANLTNEEVK